MNVVQGSQTPSLSADALLRLIRERRSIRRYQPSPVPRHTLERVLEAARWGPSAHNRQPWRFVILTNRADRWRLADAMGAQLTADLRADGLDEILIAGDALRSRERIIAAPVLIVVCLTMRDMDTYPDEKRAEHEHTMAVQSVAMAAQNLLLMAHAEGLGACWMCAPLFCQEVVRKVLDLPADYEPQGMILLGYPAEQRTKDREPLETRVIFK
ncbi:MAG TPA: nitroreductase family protein [Chloroflexi bacterium]|nr:nitroreductase family protein [Chloroflexota bacterium]